MTDYSDEEWESIGIQWREAAEMNDYVRLNAPSFVRWLKRSVTSRTTSASQRQICKAVRENTSRMNEESIFAKLPGTAPRREILTTFGLWFTKLATRF
jgi:hypothetical protein